MKKDNNKLFAEINHFCGDDSFTFANIDGKGYIFAVEDYDWVTQTIPSDKIIAQTTSTISAQEEDFDSYDCEGWDVASLTRFNTEAGEEYFIDRYGNVLGYRAASGEITEKEGSWYEPQYY